MEDKIRDNSNDHLLMGLLLLGSERPDEALQIIDKFEKDLKGALKEAYVFEGALYALRRIPALEERIQEFEERLDANLEFNHEQNQILEITLDQLREQQKLPLKNRKGFIVVTPQEIAIMLLRANISSDIVSEATNLDSKEIEILHNEYLAIEALRLGMSTIIVSKSFNLDLRRVEELRKEIN